MESFINTVSDNTFAEEALPIDTPEEGETLTAVLSPEVDIEPSNKRKRYHDVSEDECNDQQMGDSNKKRRTGASKSSGSRTGTGNNSFRYWKLKTVEALPSSFLEGINTNTQVSKVFVLSDNSFCLHLEKSITRQRVQNLVEGLECTSIEKVNCSEFRQLYKKSSSSSAATTDGGGSSKTTSSHLGKSVPTNSYFTFTVVGDTQEERFNNIAKVIEMSPVKRPFYKGEVAKTAEATQQIPIVETNESPASAAKPTTVIPHNAKGIKDIIFFDTTFTNGCFTVRNKIVKQEDGSLKEAGEDYLYEMYRDLLLIGEKIDHATFTKRTNKIKMNRHIRSWYCVRPFYANNGVPTDTYGKGIRYYRLFNDGTGLFQFDNDHTSNTTLKAAEVFGAMHPSLCIQIKGEMVKQILDEKEGASAYSLGDIIYRAKWRTSDSRPSKCFRFYSTEGKLTNDDILAIINTPNLFLSVYFDDFGRTHGLARAKGKERIVPSSIVIYKEGRVLDKKGEEEQGKELEPIPVKFTAITQSAFDKGKVINGMNSVRATTGRRSASAAKTKSGGIRSRRAGLSFDTLFSTAFTFSKMPRDLVQRIARQPRVKTLKAVKNPQEGENVVQEEEQQQDTFRGVVKTFYSVKGVNLADRNYGQLIPANAFRMKWELLSMEGKRLEFDITRDDRTSPATAQTPVLQQQGEKENEEEAMDVE